MISSSMSSHEHEATPAVAPRGELAPRQLAMPAHTNPAGDIFGGWIMASMDAAAGMTTTRLVGGRTVTVAVSNIVFLRAGQGRRCRAWFRISGFWVAIGARKQPAGEGRILAGRVVAWGRRRASPVQARCC
jgi:acyl-coenzyme A thioesterase PaaI-like protein